MHSLGLASKLTIVRWALAAGLFLSAACTEAEGGGVTAPNATAATTAQHRAAAAAVTTGSPSAPVVHPDLASFAETLGRKLDHRRESQQSASPRGGILNIPNGHVAHASVLVRGPDGQLQSACVSSPAEVSALLQRVQARVGQ